MLAHVVYNPILLEKIRCEISLAFTDHSWNMEHLTQKCPVLKSVWLETLRTSSAIGSARHITEDTIIGGKLLRRGNKILISNRQLYLDQNAFGNNAEEFEAERFLHHPELAHSPNFQPFGGGATLCPGRMIAQHITMSFVALALHRFDIELAWPQPFPRCPERMLGIGLMMSQDDLFVRLRPRDLI